MWIIFYFAAQLKEKLDEAAIVAIVVDGRSFGDFRKDGMQHFLNVALSPYQGPRRQAVAGNIDELYINAKNKLIAELDKTTVVCFTTDLWTDRCNIAYMAITAHYMHDGFQLKSTIMDFIHFKGRHTAEAIAKEFEDSLKRFGVNSKYGKTTTDRGSNIVKAAEYTETIQRLSCLGHIYHLIICNGAGLWLKYDQEDEDLDEDDKEDSACELQDPWLEDILQESDEEILLQIRNSVCKVRRLVRYFRKCIRATELLQEHVECGQRKIPIDVKQDGPLLLKCLKLLFNLKLKLIMF